MLKINRRDFLLLSAGGVVTAIGASWAIAQLTQQNQITSGKPLVSLPTHKSVNGLLELKLEPSLTSVNLGNRQAYLLAYNGQVPGPRLEAQAGDTVRIHLVNSLSQPTNLHYHGLHVSPIGNGDNPFLSIPAKESFTYEFTIPKNHRSSTFWYHPHRHPLVADQVFAGLAGLFVIRGQLDEIPEIKAAKEEFLVLQDFGLDGSGHIQPTNKMEMMMGREGKILTVNGQVKPTFSIAADGLLRLRILNASVSRFYRLALEDHPLYLIATDNGSLAAPVEQKEILLTPGERIDVLVRGEREPKQYRLLNLPYNRGGMSMMGHNSQTQTNTQVLATLNYQGSVSQLSLPEKLIPVETLPEPKTVRRIEFSMAMTSGMDMAFMFNGKTFDPNRIDSQVKLGTVEDWDLVNIDSDRMDHPFHIHTNAFQVISRNNQPEAYSAWKDTVSVRGNETVRIRIFFSDFAGKTIYHCHILDHEDSGMMGMLNIIS